MSIRFITLRTCSYTTANEIGRYLITNGIKVATDKFGSNHFGSKFNNVLCSQLKKGAPYSDIYPLDEMDFPKLITRDEDGNDILQNKRVVKTLIDTNMCENSSVAVLKEGTKLRGLDLYTPTAAEMLVLYFGDEYGVKFKETDFEFLGYLAVTPHLEITKRIDYSCNDTSQSPLIPKFKEGVITNDKNRCLV